MHGTPFASDVSATTGVTLRDLFAAHALTGLLAWSPEGGSEQMDMEDAAEDSYGFADAMLAARQPKPQTTSEDN